MSKRRAMPTTDELRAMAKMVAEYGVTFCGRTDADGVTRWSLGPSGIRASINDDGDDLDDRLAQFGAR
jgi:hypothetical protein